MKHLRTIGALVLLAMAGILGATGMVPLKIAEAISAAMKALTKLGARIAPKGRQR